MKAVLAGILPPVIAFAIQWLLWPLIRPFAWFLFIPAVFVGASLGGLWSGIGATVLSTTLAWWAFLPPERTFRIEDPKYLISTAVFIATGIAIAVFHHRRRSAERTIQAALRAIQEKNEKLEQVVNERDLFRALVENSSDFIGIADPEGKPFYVNPAGRRMVGLSPDHPIESTTIPEYYPANERAYAIDVIYKSMVEQGRFSGETYFRNWQTEETIPVSDEHFLIRDESGQRVLGMGTITRDISEIRRVAREREELLAREQAARRELEAANARLRESEERFRLTLAEAPIGMALVALDGRFVRVNRVLCEIVGYTAEELEQLTFQDLTHPDDLDSDLALADRLTRGKIPRYQLEKRYLRKGGGIVPILLSVSLLRRPDGSPHYFIVRIEDITERKRAEKIAQRLATIVQDSNDAITTQDLSGGILAWNRGAERMYGYSESEALAMNIAAIVPEGNKDTLGYLEAIRRGGKAASVEVKRRAKDGRILDVWLTTTPLFESGRPVAVATTERDITERKRIQGELRSSQQRYHTLFDAIDEGYCVIEVLFDDAGHASDYRFLEINGAFERQTGITNAVGRRMREIAPAHEEHWFQIYGEVALTGIPRRFQNPAEALGHFYDVYAFRIGNPELRQVAILFHDISERRRLEEGLRKAVRMRDDVLGVVAHDLRNPLASIIMQLSALVRRGSEPERRNRRPIEIISRAANRMNHLIQDLLDVAQIEAGGGLSIKRTELPALDLVAEAVDMQRTLAAASQLALELDVPSEAVSVWGDRDRLLQVFENLIGNAIKFSKAGGQITVGADVRGQEVVFRVSDTGCGISPESMPHLFDPFWQAAAHVGRLGAGLGLPITKGIVTAHGGRIWAESTPGQGSTFFFAIPKPGAAEERPATMMH